jgi:flagellar protein FlaF
MSNPHNPYAAAASAYGETSTLGDQRALEAKVLLNGARLIEELSTRLKNGEKVSRAEIDKALTNNRKIWQLFVNEMAKPDCPLSKDIRNNIATLSLFIFKRTIEVLVDPTPEKMRILIDINRNIASGLMAKPAAKPPGADALGKLLDDKKKPAAGEQQSRAGKGTDSLA